MSVTALALTVDEFLQRAEPAGSRGELVQGEIVDRGSGGTGHEVVKSNLIGVLSAWQQQHPEFRVMSETMFRLDDRNSPIPDVSLLRRSRIQPGDTGLIERAPELAVEVVSSESAADLETKIGLYLQHGSKAVWVVYPRSRSLYVYRAGGRVQHWSGDDTLDSTDFPAGLSTPVAALFADL